MLEPQRQQRLADFAADAALRREEDVLGELLGDGAAALGEMAGAQIGEPGAQKADRIDAEMLVEAPVFGGDDGLRQIGRHLLQRQRLAEQIAKGGDDAAVPGENRDAGPPLGDRQLIGVGQGQGEIGKHAAAENRPPQKQQNGDLKGAGQKARRGPALRRGGLVRRLALRSTAAWRGAGRTIIGVHAQRPVSHRRPPARWPRPLTAPSPAPHHARYPATPPAHYAANCGGDWTNSCGARAEPVAGPPVRTIGNLPRGGRTCLPIRPRADFLRSPTSASPWSEQPYSAACWRCRWRSVASCPWPGPPGHSIPPAEPHRNRRRREGVPGATAA